MVKRTLGLAAVALLLAAGLHAQARRPARIIAEQEAVAYASNVIDPILESYVSDTDELATVRTRLQKFLELTESKALGYEPLPFSLPSGRLAQLEWSATDRQPKLKVAIPEAMVLQENRPGRSFEDTLAFTFVAEMVRYEQAASDGFAALAARGGKPADVRSEAALWGQVIVEVVRPWSSHGRVPDQRLLAMSFALQRLRDNYKDPAWVRVYAQSARQR